MSDILHRITISAPPERVLQAITTSEGLRSWWTADSNAEPTAGSEVVLKFNNGGWVLHMRVDKLTPNRVLWTCLGDDPEWKGTKLDFDLAPAKGGGTDLRFTHGKWRSTRKTFPTCNTTWGHRFMHGLKDYAEGKPSRPYFLG